MTKTAPAEITEEADGDPPLADPPSLRVAEGPFPVYQGEIDGQPCRLVGGRDLHAFLDSRMPFNHWFERRRRYWQHFTAPDPKKEPPLDALKVKSRRGGYDWFVSLDAALRMLRTETHARAVQALEYLMNVARQRGETFEGEASRVDGGNGVGMAARNGELIEVPFRQTRLHLIPHGGEPYVPMKPVVEGMGLNWDSQLDKLRANEQRWGVAKIAIPSPGGLQQTACLPLRRLFGWLMTISPNKVKPEIKDRIIAYQQECDEVLWKHWTARLEATGRYEAPKPTPVPTPYLLPDTPPEAPHVYPFVKPGSRSQRPHTLRVAVVKGRPAFYATDLAVDNGRAPL